MNRYLLPSSPAGARIGLLGGSFDPAHDGHRHLSLQTLKRLKLDYVWWVISPQNPLKSTGPQDMPHRISAAQTTARHPKIVVSDIEERPGTQFTCDTLAALRHLYPRTRFMWLMGADNLAQFHQWRNWKDIIETTPIAVFARPGTRLAALNVPAARQYRTYKCDAAALAHRHAPAWSFVYMPLHPGSSSAIRARSEWP